VKTIIILLLSAILTVPAWAQPWPQKPPRIGHLYLKQAYWDYMKEAARRYHISPFLIEAVCAIESRFDPHAHSGRGRCYGLMQLDKDTAKKYKVDAYSPRENIMGGAAVLARLLHKYHGNIRKVLHVYNATCTSDYVYQVLLAYKQAQRCEPQLQQLAETSPASASFND
jgi:soluble lytic murein transglycosylase-like protein